MYMIRNGTYVMSLWPTTNIENLHQCEVIALTISELGNITLFCRHFEDQMKTVTGINCEEMN